MVMTSIDLEPFQARATVAEGAERDRLWARARVGALSTPPVATTLALSVVGLLAVRQGWGW